MYKDAILGNFLIHAPICMKLQPNEALHKDKKLCNYMCYTKYAPFLRFFKTKKFRLIYFRSFFNTFTATAVCAVGVASAKLFHDFSPVSTRRKSLPREAIKFKFTSYGSPSNSGSNDVSCVGDNPL